MSSTPTLPDSTHTKSVLQTAKTHLQSIHSEVVAINLDSTLQKFPPATAETFQQIKAEVKELLSICEEGLGFVEDVEKYIKGWRGSDVGRGGDRRSVKEERVEEKEAVEVEGQRVQGVKGGNGKEDERMGQEGAMMVQCRDGEEG